MIQRLFCRVPATVSARGLPAATVIVENNASWLEDLELNITQDYYTSFRKPSRTSLKATAREYLTGNTPRLHDESLLCPEMALPRHMVPRVKLLLSAGKSWSPQAVAVVHAGRAGCISPLHFDWDHNWVAHTCLTGRKTIFLLPPSAGWLLTPLLNTSALCIPRFSEPDRIEILQRLSGTAIELNAGEGVLFPSIFWHGVLYQEASLGISVRFETAPGGRPFGALPRSWWLQRVIWRFMQKDFLPEAQEFFSEYLDCFFDGPSGWTRRYVRTTKLCRRTLQSMGEEQGAEMWIGDPFSAERRLASPELKFYYRDFAAPVRSNQQIRETLEYLFDGLLYPKDARSRRLAAYALDTRQGLRPQRGLVEIIP